MSLKIAGKKIHGTTESIVVSEPVRQVKRGQFWDVRGEYEIFGEIGGRQVQIKHLLHRFFESVAECKAALGEIHDIIGNNGRCHFTGIDQGRDTDQLFEDCTVESIVTVPFGDQGIIPDVAGTLVNDDGDPDGGYFCRIIITLRQLTF